MSELLHAALRGVVAAAAMTGMRDADREPGAGEGAAAGGDREQGRLLYKVPPEHRRAAIEIAHWTYGAKGGAVYGMLPEAVRRRRWSGPVYGLVLWLGFELGIAPLLGLRHAKEPRPEERIALAADHALYGLVLSELRSRPRR